MKTMKGEIICTKCLSYGLIVLYQRVSIVPEGQEHHRPYGEGRRKQKFARIGVQCIKCGNVFLDKEHLKKIMDNRNYNRKNYRKTFPKGKPCIFEFVPHKRDWSTSKLVRVEV